MESRTLFTWQDKFAWLSSSCYCVDHTQNLPGQTRQYGQSVPASIKIGSLSAELYPNAWTPLKQAQKWIQYSAEAELRAE